MKLKSVAYFCLVAFLLAFRSGNIVPNFTGNWHTETANASFDLDLTQTKNALRGSHCSVQNGGNKIDCVLDETDISITGIVGNSSTVTVTFTSQFSQKKGSAKITKMNDSTIEWQIVTKPQGEVYLPNLASLKKQ